MRRIYLLALAVSLLSCSKSTTETNDVVATDTVATTEGDEYLSQEIEQARRPIEDIRSSFNSPQLKRNVAYVHRAAGLQLYTSIDDTGDTTKAVKVLSYGEKVELKEALINNDASDQVIVEGLKGHYAAVKTPTGDQYIFSGYLSNFPPASEGEDMLDYFKKHFHIIAPVDQQRGKDSTDIYIASQYNDIYQFESGIQVENHGYYEGSGTDVTFPEWVSMQEAFLLTRSFPYLKLFAGAFTEFPKEGEKRTVEESITAEVELDDKGQPKSIKLVDETGCYEETYVTVVNGHVVMSNGGGC